MKNRLSPMAQLRADKANLERLCQEQETQLIDNFTYLGDNWGSLLIKSIFSFGGSRNTTSSKYKEGENRVSFFSNIMRIGGDVVPVIWGIAQPYLIGLITQKIKSKIFGGSKKKREKQ